jgi:hypothetical protein
VVGIDNVPHSSYYVHRVRLFLAITAAVGGCAGAVAGPEATWQWHYAKQATREADNIEHKIEHARSNKVARRSRQRVNPPPLIYKWLKELMKMV